MSWGELVGHDEVVDRFRTALRRGRLASTFLFVGPPGIGKRSFAVRLAQALLCETHDESALDPCGTCPACQQVRAGTHPDLLTVAKPDDRSSIPLQLLIGPPEHRNQSGLCHDLGLKPARGKRKIAIIDDADFLLEEAANSLLKTLEEPPPGAVLILIGTSQQRQLNTIVSRSQVVHFRPLEPELVESILLNNGMVENALQASKLAHACNGSIEFALRLADPEHWDYRQQLFAQLASRDPTEGDFAKVTLDFIEAAGKDTAAKRNRSADIGDQAIDLFRNLILASTAQPTSKSDSAKRAVEMKRLFEADGFADNEIADLAGKCIERTMVMQSHIWANAQPVNIIPAWLSDLGRICRGEVIGIFQSTT